MSWTKRYEEKSEGTIGNKFDFLHMRVASEQVWMFLIPEKRHARGEWKKYSRVIQVIRLGGYAGIK